MKKHVTIWWLRQDLRVNDNPALVWAAARGEVLPVYIVDEKAGRAMGGASKWWLEQSLQALRKDVPVVAKVGATESVLRELIEESGADAVCWNRCYEPWAVSRDKDLKARLKDEAGVEVHSFNSALLHEPWDVKTGSGTEYKVFTPYWKAAVGLPVEAPCPECRVEWVKGLRDEGNGVTFYPVTGEPDWADGWDKQWVPGEAGAQEVLKDFLQHKLQTYPQGRDLPGADWTSKLSPHLHFGEIGPRQVWAEAMKHTGAARDKFLSEIGWREFAHHLLWHYPTMVDSNWKQEFNKYPWREVEGDATARLAPPSRKLAGRDGEARMELTAHMSERSAMADFEAWKEGRTGYPIVDAGMRQLWQTGWMHNRVRMIAASFLIKHLQIDWREGEKWFWDTLVDADAANNAAGWQWVAGSGADASPYFRVFNPFLQGWKFDPQGDYVKRWCAELQLLDAKYIHTPWQAPELILRGAKIVIGKDYPAPIVDHEMGRARALAGYAKVKS